MVGLLIVSHCDVGKELLKAAELIMGRLDAVDSVSITVGTESQEIVKAVSDKIKALDQGSGVMVLTDMFGGTPSNVSFSFLEDDRVEVLTGVNLPMVIAIVQERNALGMKELGKRALEEGRKSIALAGSFLKAQ